MSEDTQARTGPERDPDRLPIHRTVIVASVAAFLVPTASALLWLDHGAIMIAFMAVPAVAAPVVAYRRGFGVSMAALGPVGVAAGLGLVIASEVITDGRALGSLTVPALGAAMAGGILAAVMIGLIPAAIAAAQRRRRRSRAPGAGPRPDRHARAARAIRHGAVAAGIAGIITAVGVTAGLVAGPGGDDMVSRLADPWMYLDAGLAFVLAFYIHRRSRVAAVLMLVYYVWGRIYWSIEMGHFAGGLIALALLYLFGRAVWGTFVHHRLLRAAGTPTAPTAPWKIVLATLGIALIVWTSSYGALSQAGVVPPTAAVRGHELRDSERAALVSNGIVGPDERIVYFYSDGVFSIMEDGNLFTDERVVTYAGNGGALWCDSSRFEAIIDVEVGFATAPLENTTIVITAEDWRSFYLIVSTENGGDRRFARELQDRWRRARLRADTGDVPRVWFDGGTGASIEEAVVVLGARYDVVGARAALDWLVLRFGYADRDWQVVDRQLVAAEDRQIEAITIVLLDGRQRTVYFDVSESFGTPSPAPWRKPRPGEQVKLLGVRPPNSA